MSGTFAGVTSKAAVGFQGSQGAQGAPGPGVGDTGAQGRQGHQGSQGAQGSAGDAGAQGFQGQSGAAGAQGFQGLQGLQGTAGSTGSQGNQGLQGTAGGAGAQGNQGNQGFQGAVGGGSTNLDKKLAYGQRISSLFGGSGLISCTVMDMESSRTGTSDYVFGTAGGTISSQVPSVLTIAVTATAFESQSVQLVPDGATQGDVEMIWPNTSASCDAYVAMYAKFTGANGVNVRMGIGDSFSDGDVSFGVIGNVSTGAYSAQSSSAGATLSGGTYTSGAWVLLELVRVGTTTTFYVDGVSAGSSDLWGDLRTWVMCRTGTAAVAHTMVIDELVFGARPDAARTSVAGFT